MLLSLFHFPPLSLSLLQVSGQKQYNYICMLILVSMQYDCSHLSIECFSCSLYRPVVVSCSNWATGCRVNSVAYACTAFTFIFLEKSPCFKFLCDILFVKSLSSNPSALILELSAAEVGLGSILSSNNQ